LSDELHKALKEVAESEHRSIHAQIIHILASWLEQYRKK